MELWRRKQCATEEVQLADTELQQHRSAVQARLENLRAMAAQQKGRGSRALLAKLCNFVSEVPGCSIQSEDNVEEEIFISDNDEESDDYSD